MILRSDGAQPSCSHGEEEEAAGGSTMSSSGPGVPALCAGGSQTPPALLQHKSKAAELQEHGASISAVLPLGSLSAWCNLVLHPVQSHGCWLGVIFWVAAVVALLQLQTIFPVAANSFCFLNTDLQKEKAMKKEGKQSRKGTAAWGAEHHRGAESRAPGTRRGGGLG